MRFEIPGREPLDITDVLLDYNGTIAVDGRLAPGAAEAINRLSDKINFHVITADTFGSVERELAGVDCKVVKIPPADQDQGKLDYLKKLGPETTLCAGNGRNDVLMLKNAALGVAIILEEGVCVETLVAADIACRSILDVLAYFSAPDRLRATLRN